MEMLLCSTEFSIVNFLLTMAIWQCLSKIMTSLDKKFLKIISVPKIAGANYVYLVLQLGYTLKVGTSNANAHILKIHK